MAQRIVVPKGTVNPGETSVIEIPNYYQASNLVIATPKPMDRSVRQSSPAHGSGGGHGDLDISRISVSTTMQFQSIILSLFSLLFLI